MAKIPKHGQAGVLHYIKGPGGQLQVGWKGVNTEDNPGAIDDGELQRGENMRFEGGDIASRLGHAQVFDLTTIGVDVGHVPNGAADLPSDNPRIRLWMTTLGCYGAATVTGASIYRYDTTENPSFQSYGFFGTVNDYQAPLGSFGDKIYYGDRSVLREITSVTYGLGQAPAGSPPNLPVARFPGFIVRCLQEFDSKLFIGLENASAPGSSKIVVFNGLSFQDDLTGIRPPLAMGLFQDKLVVGFDSTAANIRHRPAGAAGTAYTTVGLAGFQCSPWGNAMAELRDKLWIAGATDELFSFDGTNLVLQRSIAGCDTAGTYGCTSVTVHQGLLYYLWNTTSPNFLTRLGRWDPDNVGGATEFTDTYKDITTAVANFKEGTSLQSFRSQILLGGRSRYLLATEFGKVNGTLESISAPAVVAGFHVAQLVRHPTP